TICPDCRGALDPGATCTVCGLQVKGPLALQLWNVMVSADRLVEQLRRAPITVPTAPVAEPGLLPSYPAPAARPAKQRRLPASSVQVVLLSLGGLCLLVAAVVFVAVAWSLLGLTGRTLVLLGFTGVLATVAVILTHKGLRGAAETFWLVVAGMLAIDLLGAQSAGLAGLDSLGWRGTGALVGGALLALGTGIGLWARSQPVSRLFGAEAVVAIGGVTLCSTNVWFAANPAIACTTAIPLLAAYSLSLRRPVPLAAYGMGGLAAASWLALLGVGWDRALETAAPAAWWADLRGWPLIAAAVIGAAAVYLPRMRDEVRPVLAGFSLVPVVLLANGPQTDAMPTRDLMVACATLVGLGLVTAFAQRVWALGSVALTALGISFMGLWLTFGPWNVLSTMDIDGRSDLGTAMIAQDDNAAAWTSVIAALALVVAAACLPRRLPASRRRDAAQVVGTLAPAVFALGGLVCVLELEPPLWAAVLAAALATTIAGGATWWSRDHILAASVGSTATAYLAIVTEYAALGADLLAALTATLLFAVLGLAAALRDRVGAQPSAAMAAGLSALVGGWALISWAQVVDAAVADQALALAVYAGLVGVLASPLARRTATRLTLEAAASGVAMVAVLATGDDRTTAMALTIVGTAICVMAVTTRDRALLGWAGAVVLGFATIIRVVAEVDAPELYTLPAAALLVGFGAWRLRNDPGSNSFAVLGSGLTLALLPSLLLALDEPVSLRGALIGAAGVLVLAAGVQQRLAAPFVLGALTTGILALRHLEPVADAVPRWISLGGVGLVLLVVGVTWEARRRNLDTAHRYLTALR
ncbi:MAG: hypothetical protein ABIR34_02810, partial [Marmoricola sp.]